MNRKEILLALASLFLFTTKSYAEKLEWRTEFHLPGGDAYIYGCQKALSTLKFGYTSHASAAIMSDKIASRFQIICNYPPATESLLLCLDELVGDDDDMFYRIAESLSSKCALYANVTESSNYYYNQLSNATKNYIDSSSLGYTQTFYQPTYPNITIARSVYNAYIPFFTNYDNATYFGSGLLTYFGVVMLISTIFNVLTKVGLIQLFEHPFINYIRSYITIPAIFPGGRHARPWGGLKIFSGLFPDRLEGLICLGYVILQICFLTFPYNTSETHAIVWKTPQKELQKYLADRAGIMAFAQIPLIVLFGGRNNILTFVTGFKFSSFIHFHKLVARFMFLNALIHGVCYTMYSSTYYTEATKELYFRCGITALSLVGCIWLFSLHPIRSRQYEIFLYTHIGMVISFIVMCWYHCRNLGSCEWLVAACSVWFFDRLIRIIRMSSFGYRPAVITVINEETFKVSVDRPNNYESSPGQYGFLYFADTALFFQNHPFTIFNEGQKLIMYIKVKKGVTRAIYKELVGSGGKMLKKVCIEGPYGESSPVRKYDNALLITAGAGIPGIFEHALSLSSNESPQNVKFIWIHKSYYDLQYFIDDLLVRLKNTKVVIDVYLTRDAVFDYYSASSSSSDKWSMKSGLSQSGSNAIPSFINIKMGRPDLSKLLPAEIDSFGGGSVGIVSCGPPILMDHLKHAVSKEIISYKDRIDYFDEFQTW